MTSEPDRRAAVRLAPMKPTRSPFRLLSLLLVFAPVACRGPSPAFLVEVPPGSGTWVVIAVEPAWVSTPPAHPGHLRRVVESRSNLREIAVGNLREIAEKEIGDRVRLALRTVVTSPEAEAAAAAVPAALRLVERVSRDEVLSHDPVPGNTLSTVFGLYEASIADLVAPIPEPHRTLARTRLETM